MNTCTVTIRDYPYQVKESGEGPPFIWLHGMFHSFEVEEVFSVFDHDILTKKVRLFRVELPGHGNSPLPANAERLTWGSVARDLQVLISELGLPNCVIGGFSQGAGIAAHASLACPRVKGMVLTMLPKAWDQRQEVVITYRKLLVRLDAGRSNDWMERLFAVTKYAPDALGWNRHDAERINRLMLRMSPGAFRMILEGAVLSDMPEPSLLVQAEKPSMVVGWKDDPGHPVEMYHKACEMLSPADHFILDGTLGRSEATRRLIRFIFRYL